VIIYLSEDDREHGYTMPEIAAFARLHQSTVSRKIKAADKNAQSDPMSIQSYEVINRRE